MTIVFGNYGEIGGRGAGFVLDQKETRRVMSFTDLRSRRIGLTFLFLKKNNESITINSKLIMNIHECLVSK